jgi:hypothetical protein
MRRYDASEKPIQVAYASEVSEDGSARRIFTMIRRDNRVVLAPLGHMTCELDFQSFDISKPFQTFNSSGVLVDIEPLGEFGSNVPEMSDEDPVVHLANSFLVASLKFVDDHKVPDSTETVVLLKDLLMYYPETAKAVANQISDALGPSFLYTFEIGEIERNSSLIHNGYSPNNYVLTNEYCNENFNDENLFQDVNSIVGPYVHSKKHKDYQMYLADFLSFYKDSDKPTVSIKAPVKSIEISEYDNLPSLQSRKDFRQQVLHRVQKMDPNFEKEGHLANVLEYSNMTKQALENQCNEDYKNYHSNDFYKFRLQMSCEAMSIFYGKTLLFDLKKRPRSPTRSPTQSDLRE